MANISKAEKPTTPAKEIPVQPAGKEETRLFQNVKGERVWLTKSEAESQGFYWRNTKKLGLA